MKHKLGDVLIMVTGAVIYGITELAEMMVYFQSKFYFYMDILGYLASCVI